MVVGVSDVLLNLGLLHSSSIADMRKSLENPRSVHLHVPGSVNLHLLCPKLPAISKKTFMMLLY